jgi:hypothetical protein
MTVKYQTVASDVPTVTNGCVSGTCFQRGGERIEFYSLDDESGFTKGDGGSTEASLVAKIARHSFKKGFDADARGNLEA